MQQKVTLIVIYVFDEEGIYEKVWQDKLITNSILLTKVIFIQPISSLYFWLAVCYTFVFGCKKNGTFPDYLRINIGRFREHHVAKLSALFQWNLNESTQNEQIHC